MTSLTVMTLAPSRIMTEVARIRAKPIPWISAALVMLLSACASPPILQTPASIPILMYHHVGDWGPARADWAPWVVKPADFNAQLDWLVEHGYHTINLAQLTAHREQGLVLPDKPIVLTFDDGWGEDTAIAQQYLAPRKMHGVFFVFTGAVGGSPYLAWPEVKALEQQGHEIQSHTVSHPDLRQLTAAQLDHELQSSKQKLEQELGHTVDAFAYPFGLQDERVVRAIREAGYHLAVLAEGGNSRMASDPLLLPRWKMEYGEGVALFAQRITAH